MKFSKTLLCLALAASATALAQNPYVRRGECDVGIASNTPQCPAIRYLFRGVEENPIGDVWFADASGMSKATGTMNLASGRFHLTLTSLDGQGPIGEVDGTKYPSDRRRDRRAGRAWMLEAQAAANKSLCPESRWH